MAAARIKTTLVGSYPVPDWLVALPSEQALIDATRVVISIQEQAGIDLVCDGELSRYDVNHPENNGMIEYFVTNMAGVRSTATFDEVVAYRSQFGMAYRTRPPGVVDGPIGPGVLDLPHACARAKRLTKLPFKFTLTGPHMLTKTLINKHYKSSRDLAMALAATLAEQVKHIDADVVQIDEANLPGSPNEWPWAAEAINLVLDAVKTVPAVHLCFGNYAGQHSQKGDWAKLVDYLNALHVDHIVMENASRPPDELAVFRDLRPEIGFGLGVVDIKSTVIESADQIARMIERAEAVIGPGRVKYIHPDCGFWMLKRTIADGKIRALAAGRDLFEGRASALHDGLDDPNGVRRGVHR
jgi:5-methyltetrahydropteroyltriglutamate--homocysteine methyltransferase